MKNIRLFSVLALLLALAGLFTIANTQPAEAQGQNLLTNPSFEGAYSSYTPQTDQQREACPVGVCTTAQMPGGWLPWWVPQTENDAPEINRMPEYKPVCPSQPCPFPDRLMGGSQALQYFTFHSTHTAGVWQRVNVPANSALRYSTWGQAWSSATDATYSDFPTTVNMRIGIDPTGGTNPFSPSIVWSGVQNPYDNYSLFEVEAVAQGDVVTVWMWSAPVEPRKHNDIYWDEASLVALGGAPAPAPAPAPDPSNPNPAPAPVNPPAAPPAPVGPTPTPNADGVILVTVQSGDTLWTIAARAGLTLDELLELNDFSRDQFIQAGQEVIIGYGDPEGAEAGVEGEGLEEAEAAADSEEAAADEAEEGVDEAEDGAEEVAMVEEEPVDAVEEEPEAVEPIGGTVCLRAFEDTNEDGVFAAGESLQDAVAITISNGESVVSNYVTTGAEPYCIEGLASGTYRVSRSYAPSESPTNSGDWAVAIADGSTVNIDFGSIIMAEEPMAEEVAETTASDSGEMEIVRVDDAAEEEAAGGISNGLIIAIVVVAILLLVGIIIVVMSARRAGY